MESPEFSSVEITVTESGYSEAESAKKIEGKMTDNSQRKRTSPLQQVGRQVKSFWNLRTRRRGK